MLEAIKLGKNLKELSIEELSVLCNEIRSEIVRCVANCGGHLSSNLGVVELTVMLHYVFDLPVDKLLMDVSHQCYTHKLLSGRNLDNLRQIGGVSGFYSMNESEYDCYLSGHSSTSISTALGMAVSRDLKGDNNEIIALVGDASFSNGVIMEALNNLSVMNNKVIIVLNDNEMAVSETVGGLSSFLSSLKGCSKYEKIMGLNIDYIGIVNGHDLSELERALIMAENNVRSIIVHVKTIKGYGYDSVACDKEGKWHGVGKFDSNSFTLNKGMISSGEIACDYLINNALKHNLCVITPAMKSGSKLDDFFHKYPHLSFDVGISEEHAFVFANGLALNGRVPYISVYSTFLQRAYDFINQDLVRCKSKCVVGIDRAGLVEDGESHHGIYDVALVNHFKDVMICMPIFATDVEKLLDICFKYDYLSFIRYSKRGFYISNENRDEIEHGKMQYLAKNNGDICVLAVGPITYELMKEINENGHKIDVVGVRFIKPLDEDMLKEIAYKYKKIYVYDVYSIKEGLYLPVLEFYNKNKICADIEFYGIENKLYGHGKYNDLLESNKLDVKSFLEYIKKCSL